jgi:transcriptional/translational regulatory protein YebC/TACO1
MPDILNEAVKRGRGSNLDGVNYEGTFEGYSPGGVAVIVRFATDNRTARSPSTLFSKHNGSLGVNGSVAFLFDRRA